MTMAMFHWVFVCPHCGDETKKDFIRFDDNGKGKFEPRKAEVEFITGGKDIKCQKCGNQYPVIDENVNYQKSRL